MTKRQKQIIDSYNRATATSLQEFYRRGEKMNKEIFKRYWIEKILNETSADCFDDITLLIDGQFLTQDRTLKEIKQFLTDKIIDSPDYSINKDYFIFRKSEAELMSLYKMAYALNLNAALISKANSTKYEEMRIYF